VDEAIVTICSNIGASSPKHDRRNALSALLFWTIDMRSFGDSRIGDAVRVCRHCFEGPLDRSNVITILRQIVKICRELRIREDRLARLPRASMDFGVASHPSGV
jgi:hypothetical protein